MPLSREEVRAFDRRAIEEFGVPGVVLMENAGRNAADWLIQLGVSGRVVICCGKGNNGGDGFVIARQLDIRHVPVRVLLFASPRDVTGDAAVHYGIIERLKLPIQVHDRNPIDPKALRDEFDSADWIVDALFGTGLTGPIRPPIDGVVEAINSSRARILALDIPSGLDCDSGLPLGPTVRAHYTVTFVAEKTGFARADSAQFTGKVHVADIGISRDVHLTNTIVGRES